MSGSILTFGTQWLGQLPDDWSQMRARYLFRERKQKSSTDDTHLTPSQKYAVLPQSEYMKLTGNRVVLNLTGSDNMKHVESGDFVIHLRSFQGGIEYSQYTGKVSNAYTVLQSKETVVPDFFRHVLKSYGFISELSKTTDQLRDGQSIKFSQLDLLEFPLPSPEIQQKIADFLDTETAQIDNLIAKQERLLELLEEKRRATITHAVTRGLNPSVELKETNIPWLGQIPAHWSVAKIRYLANLKTGSTPKDNEGINQEGDGSGWITPGDFVTDLYINDWTKYVTTSAQDKFKIRLFNSPSILFIGIGATAGKIGYVREPVYSNQQITAIMPNSKAVPEYMLYYLHTISGTMRSTASYATLPIINNQFLSTVMHPVPGLTEQREIAHYLDEQDKKVNKLKQKIQTQITLLRERRTSLISHAVTGRVKI